VKQGDLVKWTMYAHVDRSIGRVEEILKSGHGILIQQLPSTWVNQDTKEAYPYWEFFDSETGKCEQLCVLELEVISESN